MAKCPPKPNTGTDAPRYAPPEALIRPRNGVAAGDANRIADLADPTGGGKSPHPYILPDHKPIEP